MSPLPGHHSPPRFVMCRETNMKVRQAIPVTSELGDTGKLAGFDGECLRPMASPWGPHFVPRCGSHPERPGPSTPCRSVEWGNGTGNTGVELGAWRRRVTAEPSPLFPGEVICEPPNNKLDKFGGTLYWKENKYPLSNQNMLLRGCVLRNTEWCFGLVVFAGGSGR